ncbi:MAG: hypothetical protein ACUVUR_02885 [bacterium]
MSNEVARKAAGRWYNAERFIALLRRVNLFAGGYGSGKSEIALNFALSLAEDGKRVRVADLDIVNPYFRSREARQVLEDAGIGVLVAPEEMMMTDLPMVQPEIRGALMAEEGFVVLDLGGDPAGARAIASIAQGISLDDFNGFFVLNSRRPFTGSVDEVKGLIAGIEESSGLPVTQIVVNSHLIDETSVMVIREGIGLAEMVSRVTGKPIGFVAVERKVLNDFDINACPYPVLVLRRLLLKPWERNERLGPQRFKA